jgi:hypothetical protein
LKRFLPVAVEMPFFGTFDRVVTNIVSRRRREVYPKAQFHAVYGMRFSTVPKRVAGILVCEQRMLEIADRADRRGLFVLSVRPAPLSADLCRRSPAITPPPARHSKSEDRQRTAFHTTLEFDEGFAAGGAYGKEAEALGVPANLTDWLDADQDGVPARPNRSSDARKQRSGAASWAISPLEQRLILYPMVP